SNRAWIVRRPRKFHRRWQGHHPLPAHRSDRGNGYADDLGQAGEGEMRTLAIIIALLLATPALADSNTPPAYWSDRQLPDPKQEAEAQALMNELRCLVCQGQSIADSDAELAADMRDLVCRRIAAGEKPASIRSWL